MCPLVAPEDFQIPDTTLIFVDATNDLQQCFNITIVDDGLVEPREVFQLIATSSSGESASQFVIIDSDNGWLRDIHYYGLDIDFCSRHPLTFLQLL